MNRGQLKSLKILWQVVATEVATWCRTSAAFDVKTVERRVEHEGLSFLTITLPSFCKDFEQSLEQEKVDSNLFAGFSRLAGGPLPKFLGGFLRQVFDIRTGRLLDQPNKDCILAIRQLTLMFGKILIPCSDARVQGALDGYVKCEREVTRAAVLGPEELYNDFSRIAALLFADVFQELENELYENVPPVPRHGPGATADRLRGNAKFDQSEWTTRLESMFSFIEHASPSWVLGLEKVETGAVHFREPGNERPVKVITVPKTLKTPRIIAVEPTCMQYMQQAIAIPLVGLLESKRVGRNTRLNAPWGQVGFSDQVPNRLLSENSSVTREGATLDLSEASDRVSTRHVSALVSRWPLLQEALMVTRSEKASVPGYGVIPLSKYASMGSALCFPVEAMVFLTSVYMGIEKMLNRRLTRRDIFSLRGKVRVYGDDIIVPVDSVRFVIEALESLGFKVNSRKSFWNGKFRESCGADFYDGMDVTPIRVRREFPSSRRDAQSIVSLIELRNLFYTNGFWMTAKHLDEVIGEVIRHFPIVESTSPILGRISVFRPSAEGWDPVLQTPVVKGYVVRTVAPSSEASGFGALMKFFLKQGEQPYADKKHLERFGRPQVVDIKLGWRAPW